VSIATRLVFGTLAGLVTALVKSRCGKLINTAFLKRRNGTDRRRNARKALKTYRFSKILHNYELVMYLTMYVYNFRRQARTL